VPSSVSGARDGLGGEEVEVVGVGVGLGDKFLGDGDGPEGDGDGPEGDGAGSEGGETGAVVLGLFLAGLPSSVAAQSLPEYVNSELYQIAWY